MTEKDNVSMATVQMKTDYAASEVYSTASEAPPAYKRPSNSVKIAKIVAFTVIVSSFILGSFILASSYLDAKASCDQVQALDSMLQKELMLESLQQINKELPRAEALLGKDNIDVVDLQNLEKEPVAKKETAAKSLEKATTQAGGDDDSASNADADNQYNESDEADEMQRYPGKVQLDLSDLAEALLQSNKKSRMNCVVERKHAEEFVDTPAKTVSLPFGMNLTTDPKKARITGERISIYCEGGNEHKTNDERDESAASRGNRNDDEESDTEEDVETIRPMFVPYMRGVRFGNVPPIFPLTHMPMRMLPPMGPQQQQQSGSSESSGQMPPRMQAFIRQEPPPFQQLPLRPPMPPQVMEAPRPDARSLIHNVLFMRPNFQRQEQQEPQPPQQQAVRIHVQQIPFREIHVSDALPIQVPSQHQELPHLQIQRVPAEVALQRAGITADDLRNFQRMAEERITEELRRLAAEDAAESAENSSSTEEDDDSAMDGGARVSQPPQQQSTMEQSQAQTSQTQHMHSDEATTQRTTETEVPQRLILQPLPEQPRDAMYPPMADQRQHMMMPSGRSLYGRSLPQPVRIPVPMMGHAEDATTQETERQHFVQPRSV